MKDKASVFIPPRWGIMIFSLLLTICGICFCFAEPSLAKQGVDTGDFRLHPIWIIIPGLIGVFFSSFCFTVSEKRIICHYMGIFFRRLYWVEFRSGIALRRGKDGRGEEGKLVVYLTLRGTPDFDPEGSAWKNTPALDKAIRKYASSHPIGVIKIVISKKEMEAQCLEAFSELCPNFRIIPDQTEVAIQT